MPGMASGGSFCWQHFGLPSPFADVMRATPVPRHAFLVLMLSQTAAHGLMAYAFCTAPTAMLSALLFACIT